jgi:hypothetical protein
MTATSGRASSAPSWVSELDRGWDATPSPRRRLTTLPWDDRPVLDPSMAAAVAVPAPPEPPSSAIRGGTRSWDELELAIAAARSKDPAPSPTRGGTLQWDAALFDVLREQLEAKARDAFDDLRVDATLEALPPPSALAPPSRRALPSLTMWTRDQPIIEVGGETELDPGDLSIVIESS